MGGNKAVAKLWMVDLGGSERLLKTGATGQTLKEGKAINLSLSALGDVIASLKKKRNHIPYRNSKLTQILSDSLGDGSKVLMIVHISPSIDDVGETICSLSFAKRVRAIETNRELSEELKNQKEKCIAELDKQIKDTEVELQEVRYQIERAEQLLQEKMQFYPLAHQLREGQKGSPSSPLIVGHEIAENPGTAEEVSNRACNASIPHFMASTVSSRHRLRANEQANVRTKPLLGKVDLLCSQSLSYSEPYMKPNPVRLKSKLVMCDPSCNSVDSKSSLMNKKVSTSHL